MQAFYLGMCHLQDDTAHEPRIQRERKGRKRRKLCEKRKWNYKIINKFFFHDFRIDCVMT